MGSRFRQKNFCRRRDLLPQKLQQGISRNTNLPTNADASYLAAADQLYATLKARALLDRVIIGSFRDEVAAYITANYPDVHRSASPDEVVQFYFAALIGKKDFTCSYDVLQLPFGDAESSFGINLGTTTVINFAHAHDLAIQYWTVNAEEDIQYLASVGADALITDYPDRAAKILNSRQ